MEYKYNKYHDNGMVRYERAFIIRVSRHNIGRALRFMDTLIKLIRARGHNLETKTTYSIYIDEVHFDFKVMEKTQKANQQEKWGYTRFENWIRWAKEKADWYDPLVNKADDLLNQMNINKLLDL